jgi:hypothetical protein
MSGERLGVARGADTPGHLVTRSPCHPVTLRRTVYALLITVAAGATAGRILAVARLSDPGLYRTEEEPDDGRGLWPKVRPAATPTLGDNDRSRWDTVRALVDDGTYVIGHRDRPAPGAYHDRGIIVEDGWKSIDKVLRPDTQDFYSSKPPFLATLVAGEYWLLKQALGWSIVEQRWEVVRTILMTVNWLPMIAYLALLSRLVDRLGTTDWGRLYVMTAASIGTFLSSFAITLNNHSVATCTALFALAPALRIWYGGERRPALYALAGFFAGFTACSELPALSFAAALLVLLGWRAPGRTLAAFVPAALLPVLFFFATNYLAIGRFTPAYGEFGGPWYEYEGSHWARDDAPKRGIDWAGLKETKGEYAFHLLAGHHGVFSLTPIFLLTVGGLGVLARPRRHRQDNEETEELVPASDWRASPAPMLAGLTLLLSVVVIGFYIYKSDNYGGWTSGPRWLIWLTPLWLLSMLPAADWLGARRWGRGLAYVLLAVSVLSATYPPWSPWRHPWLYNWLQSQGWIAY